MKIESYRPQRIKHWEVKKWTVDILYTSSIVILTLAGATFLLGTYAAYAMS